jgi:hypothetical protein
VGPCREWQETMWTSGGRYFSKAVFSGALTEVWPATIAPTFVAGVVVIRLVFEEGGRGKSGRTRTELSDYTIDELCFDGVHDPV